MTSSHDLSNHAVTVRSEQPSDEPFLLKVFASTRQAELNALPGDPAIRELFLRQQFQAMRQGYRNVFPRAEFLIIQSGETPVGRWVVDRGESEWRIIDLALLPEWRGRGIGTRLISRLLEQAQAKKVAVALQVTTANPAIRLYERLGFVRTKTEIPYQEMKWNPAVRMGEAAG